jgi:hypothetical protein
MSTNSKKSEYLTPIEAARELMMTPGGVRTAIRRGALPALRVLGRLKLRAEDVRAAKEGSPTAAEVRHAKR